MLVRFFCAILIYYLSLTCIKIGSNSRTPVREHLRTKLAYRVQSVAKQKPMPRISVARSESSSSSVGSSQEKGSDEQEDNEDVKGNLCDVDAKEGSGSQDDPEGEKSGDDQGKGGEDDYSSDEEGTKQESPKKVLKVVARELKGTVRRGRPAKIK